MTVIKKRDWLLGEWRRCSETKSWDFFITLRTGEPKDAQDAVTHTKEEHLIALRHAMGYKGRCRGCVECLRCKMTTVDCVQGEKIRIVVVKKWSRVWVGDIEDRGGEQFSFFLGGGMGLERTSPRKKGKYRGGGGWEHRLTSSEDKLQRKIKRNS